MRQNTTGCRDRCSVHSLIKGTTIMYEYIKTWVALKTDRRAVTALEYGLIAGIIVAVIALGFGVLGTNLSTKFSNIGSSL